ncbi:hypothetical protein AAFF_G00242390 [Aldrovandia affinis]|uniref:Uncharacterized protein n=1 Tax=Aldrovandia affinis TaxID=143900 RepID=A0AAD7W336_9TELE|nr:hypothetical protein AAFF_G00242390 [Aldrovandia affinis]
MTVRTCHTQMLLCMRSSASGMWFQITYSMRPKRTPPSGATTSQRAPQLFPCLPLCCMTRHSGRRQSSSTQATSWTKRAGSLRETPSCPSLRVGGCVSGRPWPRWSSSCSSPPSCRDSPSGLPQESSPRTWTFHPLQGSLAHPHTTSSAPSNTQRRADN